MSRTVCGNCGNTQGPFLTVAPGLKVCPPLSPKKADGSPRHPKEQHAPIKACLARRDKLDNERYGAQPE